MKTCEEVFFGISIDKHVLLKASLALLCFLSLLLILISILAVWLRKIQRQLVCLTKNICSLPLVISNKKAATFKKRHSWKSLVGVNSYGLLGFDGDRPRSELYRETSFDNSLAPEDDGKSLHDSKTQEEVDGSPAAHYSTSNHPQMNTRGNYKLEKDYMSLKNLKGVKEHTYATPCAKSPRLKNKMERDVRQNGRNEKQTNDTHKEDNEYLVVIHSDKSPALSAGTETETPPREDESLYLIPIESKPEENGHQKMERKTGTEFEEKSKANGVSKNDGRLSPLDDPEKGKYGYIPGQRVGKLTTFGHNDDFQQTQPEFSKDSDEDDSGYLILQHVEGGASGKAGTSIPVGPFQAGGTSESERPVNPCRGDDNSYEYIQTKDWTGPVDNSDSKVQKNNPIGKGKPVPNSLSEDNHDYLTAVHEKEVNSSKEQEHSTDRIFSIIHDSNNNNNAGVQSEFGVQNLGVEYSDDGAVYDNKDAQQQSSMCNDNPASCNVDESPLYDNPVTKASSLAARGSNCK